MVSKIIGRRAANGDPSTAIPPALPPSVEEAYRRKCLQLKRRTNEVEEDNEAARLRLARLRRGVEKLRLERAFLLEQLARRTSTNVEDSDGSPSPPPTVRPEAHDHSRPPARVHAHSPSLGTPGPRSCRTQRNSPSPLSGIGSGEGTNHDLPLRQQPQDKPLRSKRGHRKPSIVAALEPSNAQPSTIINQSIHNLSPSSDAFSHSVHAEATASQTNLKEHPGPRSNGLSVSASSSKAAKKPSNAFQLYCQDNREAAKKNKAEGVRVEEELARCWKNLSASKKEEYMAREKAEAEKDEKDEKDAESERPAESQADESPARDEDVDMENDD